MARILHATDLHLHASRPRARKDDYTEALLRKLKFVVDCANEDCDAVIFSGDLFDSANEPAELVQRAQEVIDASDIPWFLCAGQHDIEGYQTATAFQGSSFGRLVGRCRHCSTPMYDTVSEKATWVTCYTFHDPAVVASFWDVGTSTQWMNPDTKERNLQNAGILVVHDMIVPRQVPWNHILSSSILAPPNCKVILAGDYHARFSAKTANGVPVVNPGALARKTVDDADRAPAVWKFTLDDDGLHDTEKTTVPHAPKEEVFRLDEIEQAQQESVDTSRFEESVQALASTVDSSDPHTILDEIAKTIGEEDQRVITVAKKLVEDNSSQ